MRLSLLFLAPLAMATTATNPSSGVEGSLLLQSKLFQLSQMLVSLEQRITRTCNVSSANGPETLFDEQINSNHGLVQRLNETYKTAIRLTRLLEAMDPQGGSPSSQ